jgi:LysR family cys regulon transcriptional activator
VIKTYVRLGLGVGIVASMAYEEEEDRDLVAIDGAHLFPDSVTWIGVRQIPLGGADVGHRLDDVVFYR